ncbi:MAG: type II toxin-antitoxin system RatA family toxin [Gammaproteobacteria bacterium]|nr:type II toxin-antitoxin system RatA family toxin [Gammaproteobacteria bacterium]
MSAIHQTEFVPYSPEQMFGLVADVDAYPSFLPWCVGASQVAYGEDRVRATLKVAKGKIGYTFTTDNVLAPGKRIEMRLANGPFKRLHGTWRFDPMPTGCRVTLDMEFEFTNRLVAAALSPLFKAMTSQLVASFRHRAQAIYG